jgi:RNA polymerase sigma-32 factor
MEKAIMSGAPGLKTVSMEIPRIAEFKECHVFLNAEQERDLAHRCRHGDEKAGQELARAYMPLVKRIAKEFFGAREDLVSEGYVGLMKAIERFDPDQGARLGTYAAFWIRAEIREFIRRDVKMESLNEPVGEEGPEQIHLLADERDNQEQALGDRQERRFRAEFVKRALNSLSDQERRIVVERRLRRQATPLKDLGARFGVSGERIRVIELKAIDAMTRMATGRL